MCKCDGSPYLVDGLKKPSCVSLSERDQGLKEKEMKTLWCSVWEDWFRVHIWTSSFWAQWRIPSQCRQRCSSNGYPMADTITVQAEITVGPLLMLPLSTMMGCGFIPTSPNGCSQMHSIWFKNIMLSQNLQQLGIHGNTKKHRQSWDFFSLKTFENSSESKFTGLMQSRRTSRSWMRLGWEWGQCN